MSHRKTRISFVPIGALIMAISRTPEFMSLFAVFATLIESRLAKFLDAKGTGFSADIFPQQGRVFDKLVAQKRVHGKAKGKPEVLFFIRQSDGQIFGPKSEIAPNLNWWYGSLTTVKDWDWADPHHPVPKNPENFRALKTYADHTHYVPKGMHMRLAERKTPLPSERKKRVAKKV